MVALVRLRAVNLTLKALHKLSLKKEVCRKRPLTQAKVQILECFLNFHERVDVEYAALFNVCHDVLLRCGGVKIRLRHLIWRADKPRLRYFLYTCLFFSEFAAGNILKIQPVGVEISSFSLGTQRQVEWG